MNYITPFFVLYVVTLRWKKVQPYSIYVPALPASSCVSILTEMLRQGLIIWGGNELPV